MQLSIGHIPVFVNTVLDAQTENFSELNRESIIVGWQNLMEGGHGVAYGAVADGIPTGFLLAVHTLDIMTGLRKGFEYLLMVDPAYRAGGTALRLIQEFESDSKEKGCIEAVLGCNVAYKPKVLGRFYRTLGYEPVSESFRKKL